MRLHRANRPEPSPCLPWTRRQTAELAGSAARVAPLTADCARALQAHSEGNPFFAEELLRGWHHAGALHLTPLGWPARRGGRRHPGQHPLGRSPADRPIASGGHRSLAGGVGDRADLHDRSSWRGCWASRPRRVEDRLHGGGRPSPDRSRRRRRVPIRPRHHPRLPVRRGQHRPPPAPARADRIGAGGLLRRRSASQQLAELAFHFSRSDDAVRGACLLSPGRRARAGSACAFEQAAVHWQAVLRQLPEEDEQHAGRRCSAWVKRCCWPPGRSRPPRPSAPPPRGMPPVGSDSGRALSALRGLGLGLWRQDALDEAHDRPRAGRRAAGPAPRPGARGRAYAGGAGDAAGQRAGRALVGAAATPDVALQLARLLQDPRLEASASRTMGFLLVLENRMAAGAAAARARPGVGHRQRRHGRSGRVRLGPGPGLRVVGSLPGHAVVDQPAARRTRAPVPSSPTDCTTSTPGWRSWPLPTAIGAQAEADLDQARNSLAGAASVRPSAFLHQIRGYLAYQRAEFLARPKSTSALRWRSSSTRTHSSTSCASACSA